MGQHIYITAANLLSSGKRIVLARTIRRAGSTPRDVGSMCIITEDNQIIGTVGGGLLEYKVHKKAMILFEKGHSFIYKFKLSNDDLAKNGMICGGDVDLFLEPLFPGNPATMSIFKKIAQQIENNKPATLISLIENNLDAMAEDTRFLIIEDGSIKGELPDIDTKNMVMKNLNKKSMGTKQNAPYQLIKTDSPAAHLFIEQLQLRPRIFLFGAGHVSKFVAQVAKLVDFDITIIDDRPEFANKDRFPDADTICVADFKLAFKELNISA
ncbi:MAG: XdhC family protein, partial [Desulfobacula sp.]|nr:XdhC family protein [Desulfobacula sp.]